MRFQSTMRGMAVATLAAAITAGVAEARNPHCAGGIQYVVQGMRDKEKGNTEDYKRQMNKAVQQLEQCAAEDPADYEAIGYLGWAYAEVDSASAAGKAFRLAIEGAEKKADKKKKEMIEGNLNSYWVTAFNDGIKKIQQGQSAYADFCKQPATDAEKAQHAEAVKQYAEATAALTRANLLKPGNPQTLRNLGSALAFQCDYRGAEAYFREGLKAAPGDSTLVQSLKSVRTNLANQLVDQKKYDEALAFYTELSKEDPTNCDNFLGIADVYFKRAQALEGEARKPEFKAAGDAYGKASDACPKNADLSFNAGLAYQNAGAWDRAEVYWKRASELRPDDIDALSSLGAVLAEQKKCPDAVNPVFKAVSIKPQEKNLHRQLGAIYTKCGNSQKATEELMIFLAMQNGKPVNDAAAHAKTARDGSSAAKTFASEGPPDQIIPWVGDGVNYETWFYWNKKQAFTYNSGTLVTKSDWTAMATAAGGKK